MPGAPAIREPVITCNGLLKSHLLLYPTVSSQSCKHHTPSHPSQHPLLPQVSCHIDFPSMPPCHWVRESVPASLNAFSLGLAGYHTPPGRVSQLRSTTSWQGSHIGTESLRLVEFTAFVERPGEQDAVRHICVYIDTLHFPLGMQILLERKAESLV